jgi:hypothetical protein
MSMLLPYSDASSASAYRSQPTRGVTRSASGSACFRWEEYLSIVTTTQPEMLTSAPSTSNARLLVWPAVGCAPSGPTADPPASAILPRRRPFAWCSARNLDEPDSKCDLNHLRGNAVAKSVEIAMSNSFAFGGHNVSPVFGPHPQAADAVPGIASRRSEVALVDTRLTTGDTIAQRQTRKEQIPVEPASRQLLLNG